MSKDTKPVFRDVFAHYWALYEARYGKRIPGEHRTAARAILNCRTPVMGGSLYRCGDCGCMHYACHGCNHRNCPQCGYQDAVDWAMRLNGLEFIRRFMQHVLPGGFKRIRNYGWLSPAAHKKFDKIRGLLNCRSTGSEADESASPDEATQNWSCKRCGGTLQLFKTWDRGRAPPAIFKVSLSLHEKKPLNGKPRAAKKKEKISV